MFEQWERIKACGHCVGFVCRSNLTSGNSYKCADPVSILDTSFHIFQKSSALLPIKQVGQICELYQTKLREAPLKFMQRPCQARCGRGAGGDCDHCDLVPAHAHIVAMA